MDYVDRDERALPAHQARSDAYAFGAFYAATDRDDFFGSVRPHDVSDRLDHRLAGSITQVHTQISPGELEMLEVTEAASAIEYLVKNFEITRPH